MKTLKNILPTLSITFLLCLFASTTFAEGITFIHDDMAKAKETAKAEGKLIFVDVYATWCGPCKYLSRDVFPDADLGEFYNQNFVALKLNGEIGDGLAVMRKFNLDSYPTLLFLDANGELVQKKVGALGADALLRWGRDVLDPESSELNQHAKRFKNGDREREFLTSYMLLLSEADQPAEDVLAAYMENYPKLNLENEHDFLVFYLGVNDLSHPAMQEFLNNIGHYEEAVPGVGTDKILEVLQNYLGMAVTVKDEKPLMDALEQVYEPLKVVTGDECPEYAALQAELRELYQSAL